MSDDTGKKIAELITGAGDAAMSSFLIGLAFANAINGQESVDSVKFTRDLIHWLDQLCDPDMGTAEITRTPIQSLKDTLQTTLDQALAKAGLR